VSSTVGQFPQSPTSRCLPEELGRRGLMGMIPPVDTHDVSGHIARVVTGQEEGGLCDVLRLTDVGGKQMTLHQGCMCRTHVPPMPLPSDWTRCDRIATNALLSVGRSNLSSERIDSRL
jgi:hypothetical protein